MLAQDFKGYLRHQADLKGQAHKAEDVRSGPAGDQDHVPAAPSEYHPAVQPLRG